MVADDLYITVTTNNSNCSAGWQPGKHGAGVAKYAIPVPFLPGATTSRIRLEYTVAPGARPTKLTLLRNATQVAGDQTTAHTTAAERQCVAPAACSP